MQKFKTYFHRYPVITAIFLGVLYPFGFAPFYWVIPSLISIAGLYALWQPLNSKQAAKTGFFFAFTAFIVGANWILTSIGVFGGAPMWLAVVLMLGLHSIMGLYFALLGFATVQYVPKLSESSSSLKSLKTIGLYASVFVLLEWLRAWFLSGFPWFNLGYLSIGNPIAGFAPLGGVHLVSLIFVVIALSFLMLLQEGKTSKFTGLGLIFTLTFSGFALTQIDWSVKYKAPLSVALIQGGVSQDKKWLPEQLPKTMGIYYDLSLQNADADLVVWPEAAIPNLRDQSLEFYRLIKERLGRDTGFVLSSLVAFPQKENGTDDIRHGFYVVDDQFGTDTEEAYYKQHLVPYGEYFPVPDFVAKWMLENGLLYGDVTPGSKDQSALQWNGYRLGAFICYEDAYPNIVRSMFESDKEANFLVNVTNDAWFSGSFAPFQHLQITQMRALEMARPVLRATNDGVTAIIEYKGKVLDTAPQYQPEVLRGEIQPRKGMTPYARLGNWPVLLLCFGLLGFYFVKSRETI